MKNWCGHIHAHHGSACKCSSSGIQYSMLHLAVCLQLKGLVYYFWHMPTLEFCAKFCCERTAAQGQAEAQLSVCCNQLRATILTCVGTGQGECPIKQMLELTPLQKSGLALKDHKILCGFLCDHQGGVILLPPDLLQENRIPESCLQPVIAFKP